MGTPTLTVNLVTYHDRKIFMQVTLRMALEIDDAMDQEELLNRIEEAVMSIDGVSAAPRTKTMDDGGEKTLVERMGLTTAEMEEKLRRSFYDSCLVMLVQDLLMRSGSDGSKVREILIDTWKSSILRQHEAGVKVMQDAPEEERGAFDPEVQERYLVSMVEEIGAEFRSIFSGPISFKPPEDSKDD